jgi:Zn finger protein HypA/HybF involved in hydrogenase expression
MEEVNMHKGSATSRTPKWKTAVHQTVRCANCAHVSDADTLDTRMTCPECNHSEWTVEAVNPATPPTAEPQSDGKV